jgi:hypothetical protein
VLQRVTVPIPSLTSHIAPEHAFRPDYGAVLHREQRGPVGLERTCDWLATARFCRQSLLTPKPRFLALLPILALEASSISPRCAHAPRTGLVGLTARPAGVTIRAWLPRLRQCRRLVPGDDRSSNQPPSVRFTLEAECISTRPRRPGARIGRSVFGAARDPCPLSVRQPRALQRTPYRSLRLWSSLGLRPEWVHSCDSVPCAHAGSATEAILRAQQDNRRGS